MIAANDPLESANDNPPKPIITVVERPMRMVGADVSLHIMIDASQLLAWFEQRGLLTP